VSDWVAWFQVLLKAGVTTVLLDPVLEYPDGDAGAESIEMFIRTAHVASLSVWGRWTFTRDAAFL